MTARPIVIVRPGPVLVVYQNGKEVIAVDLSEPQEAVFHASRVLEETRIDRS